MNEVTGGFTRNILQFDDPEHPRTYEICRGSCIFGSPLGYWPGTGRKPTELQFIDNLTWIKGSHALKGGGTARRYHIRRREARAIRSGSFRASPSPGPMRPSAATKRTPWSGLTAALANLTGSGINATDRNNLNTLYNVMLGRLGRIDQVFYSNGQEFVPLQPLTLDQRMQEYNFYVQDDWRLRPNLTVNVGLRYELNTVPYDAAGVQVVPDRPLDGSQGPVTFVQAGPGTGESWFNRTTTTAPSIGVAWDPAGNGRTSCAAATGWRISA